MPHERTLPGNPNRLTIAQHIFPRSAIARFTASDGRVTAIRIGSSKPFRPRPNDEVFCARRVWDQKAETTGSRRIEEAYADLADRLTEGSVLSLTAQMDAVATNFYLLWNHRFNIAALPQDDVQLKTDGINDFEPPLTKEQEEAAELKGAMFRRGNTILRRFINGLTIQRENDRGMEAMQGKHWGIARANGGDFLVPDNTAQFAAIPVTPSICLLLEHDDMELTTGGVAQVNLQLVNCAKSYFFGQDLQRCPIQKE